VTGALLLTCGFARARVARFTRGVDNKQNSENSEAVDCLGGHAGGAARVPLAVLVVCTLHAALHVFYIATWDTRHTERVIRLSSTDARRRLATGKYGAAELAWFFAGTAFDMLTHGSLLWLLLTVCSPTSVS
jgi:hypothetical protein